MEKFSDRQEAGTVLASYLEDYARKSDVIILALPRGGVPVAYEIALELSIPLDVCIVRKLGVPGHEELAMGAIAAGGAVVLNEPLIDDLKIDKSTVDAILHLEQKELSRRELLYRGNRPFPDLSGKTILLVDDGIATGTTMRVAIMALRNYAPAQIIIAVPVAAQSIQEEMGSLVDNFICPLKPIKFYAVGMWYEHFSQTTDSEVIELLEKTYSTGNYPR